MKQKIEWYKEVLELEPASRVFFPLAKQLDADTQTEEAIAILQRGLLAHPDHLEARLLLIELLAKSDKEDSILKELSSLSSLFCRYPSFWNAWSGYLAKYPSTKDAALALRFFAAALSGQKITWASVIDQGIVSALSESSSAQKSTTSTLLSEPLQPSSFKDGVAQGSNSFEDNKETAPVFSSSNSQTQQPYVDVDHDDDAEEDFSLRTRSMAEVLAEQGDILAALDIYKELLGASTTKEEKEELQECINVLSKKNSTITPDYIAPACGDNIRLVSLLESLAQRLETRAN